MAKTNPIPPGTKNVSINMPKELAQHLGELAAQSNMSPNRYCAEVLNDAARSNTIIESDTRVIRRSETAAPVTYLKRPARKKRSFK